MRSWSPRSIAAAAVLAAALGGALVLTPKDGALPSQALPALSGPPVALSGCPTQKCLTVVVAPWCGYCRASTEKLVELKKFLEANKTAMRVVVGLAAPAELADYAREFGPQTLLDAEGVVSTQGVPFFIVSDAAGTVLETKAGVPQGGIRSVAEFAGSFGLP